MTAPRFEQEEPDEEGWSRWVQPIMQGYKMACCDCGLVHTMEFRALHVTDGDDSGFNSDELDTKEYRVEFRVRRNNRSTAQIRRRMSKGTK